MLLSTTTVWTKKTEDRKKGRYEWHDILKRPSGGRVSAY